jgi:hypothetical protein
MISKIITDRVSENVNVIKVRDVKSTWLNKKLRNFPKCGVRFGSEDGHGFVLIDPRIPISSLELIADKIAAVSDRAYKGVSLLIIPSQYATAKKITIIPTLTELA